MPDLKPLLGHRVRKIALETYTNGNTDFSDCLILELAGNTKALPVQTFDRRLASHTDVSLLAPE